MAQITQEQIIKLNELYLEIGTYAGVSRAMGGSPAPSTVKKYIIPNFQPAAKMNFIRFKAEEIPIEVKLEQFKGLNDWGKICLLTEQEKEDMKELWKEMVL